MILAMLYVAVLVAGLWPRSAVGRALRRLMMDMPRAALAWFTPGRLLLTVGLALAVMAVIAAARTDLALFAAQSLPEGVVWAVSFDVATWLDVIALAWLLAATVRLRAAARVLRSWADRVRTRFAARRVAARARRARRVGRKAGAKGSDEDGGWAFA